MGTRRLRSKSGGSSFPCWSMTCARYRARKSASVRGVGREDSAAVCRSIACRTAIIRADCASLRICASIGESPRRPTKSDTSSSKYSAIATAWLEISSSPVPANVSTNVSRARAASMSDPSVSRTAKSSCTTACTSSPRSNSVKRAEAAGDMPDVSGGTRSVSL